MDNNQYLFEQKSKISTLLLGILKGKTCCIFTYSLSIKKSIFFQNHLYYYPL